jgi:hypothetical protein
MVLSKEHLRRSSVVDEASAGKKRGAVTETASLVAVMSNEHAGERHLIDEIADQCLDALPGLLVEGGRRLVEQKDLRLIGQGASQRDALLFSAGKLGNVAGGEASEANAFEQSSDFRVGQQLSFLCRTEANVGDDVAGEEEWALGHHADAAAQFARPELTVVLVF